MKWGVRKSEYKSMNRAQRKATRQEYYKTDEGRVLRNTKIGTFLGGPLVGAAAGMITQKRISKGKNVVEKYKDKTVKECEQNLETIKSANDKNWTNNVFARKSSDGHYTPYFTMNEDQRRSVDEQYAKLSVEAHSKVKNAKTESARQKAIEAADKIELDYLDVVEQDFYYTDPDR